MLMIKATFCNLVGRPRGRSGDLIKVAGVSSEEMKAFFQSIEINAVDVPWMILQKRWVCNPQLEYDIANRLQIVLEYEIAHFMHFHYRTW